MKYRIIDLFAGPGGLGEGFASLDDGSAFEIVVSAEMESSAHQTLTLRSFFRHIQDDKKALQTYYDFCNSAQNPHPKEIHPTAWALAEKEARQLTLGDQSHNAVLDEILEGSHLNQDETVLIGGPPCQAYSLMGRARNMGKENYVAEEDHRHFLYREYLRILHKTRPAAFVMENVKGILSSKVNGKKVFHDILRDLTDPGVALRRGESVQYNIHSLVTPTCFEPCMDPESIDVADFIIEAEKYGIPQARHRVILLGVRTDIKYSGEFLLEPVPKITVNKALNELPRLRSKLSHEDSPRRWRESVVKQAYALAKEALNDGATEELAGKLISASAEVRDDLATGALRMDRRYPKHEVFSSYQKWVTDRRLSVWLNNETRSHMYSDLGRYFYASVFAEHFKRSPKGHRDFSLKGLAPEHANWESGKFVDRFRVQLKNAPSSTVTSHISKDGHYFIHPDPRQCRSLTVREAARLQTFPDNYFFQGNRTQQYHQVGNAVPSLLARQIAQIVKKILD